MKTTKDSPLLRVAVLSDLHMDERSWRARRLERALARMERAERLPDLLIVPGDVTDDGAENSWRCVKRIFAKYRPAEQVLFAIGNHDTDGGETGQRNFIQYTNEICGLDLEKPYYSRVVNGIPFLFLGSEGSALDAVLSEEQIAWFDQEAAAAAETGKPVFVICHQSFNGTHGLPYTWNRDHSATDPMEGGIGVKNDRIRAILSQYRNVFYISGHIHEGLCRGKSENGCTWSSVENLNGIRLVNAPCFMFPNHDGDPAPGKGYMIEIFENKVLLLGRDFLHGVWDPNFVYSFDQE
ncbi:MAG: metallophosphoesterase [Clostridia bacterium]|nr:metallophosphoesterase [Clostridia bacterium]